MLKSWPIECDCKNDHYDSTAEIQSFFYITQVSNADWTQAIQALENLKVTIDPTLSLSGKAADAAKVGEAVNAESERAKGVESQIKEDIVYKRNVKLTPVQFETVLGYYGSNEFISGKKEWNSRLMRVPVEKGDRYLYHGYCDNIYGVNFLNSDLNVIRQIHVPVHEEFEMDIDVAEDASYIDFYSGDYSIKTYVLKYDKTHTDDTDTGRIFTDSSSEFTITNDKYFTPRSEDLVNGAGMILKLITPETDTVYKFSFTAMQVASAYIDDFCIVTNNNYSLGTEVFYENIVAFVPAGKNIKN